MRRFITLLIFFFSAVVPIFAQHKIIYLISGPRSLSVAFMRMMQARDDFTVVHEPSMWAYDRIHYYDLTKDWFVSGASETFEVVKKNIYRKAEDKNVFVKDMSIAVRDFIREDKELIQNPNVYFVFLVRNPHHATISFYNKTKDIIDNLDAFLGYEATYALIQETKKYAKHTPCIVLSEDLYTRPKDVICDFCHHVGISFDPKSLMWEQLGDEFDAYKEWSETKKVDFTKHWHIEAMSSSEFTRPTEYEVDSFLKPTFSEIQNQRHKDAYVTAYKKNLPFYEKILLEKELILKGRKDCGCH